MSVTPKTPNDADDADDTVNRRISTLPPAARKTGNIASFGTDDDLDEPPVTRRARSAPPSSSGPSSSGLRDPFTDALCATAYLLGMRTEEIAEAISRPLPAWMNAMARAPSAEARSRLLAPTLMDIEESLDRTRPR